VHLFETDFRDHSLIEGPVSRARPPRLSGKTVWANDPDLPFSPSQYGAAVILHDIPERDILGFVSSARILGPLPVVKEFLRGRKFFILNRCANWVCVELT